MGPTWVPTVPGEPHVGPMNLAISVMQYLYLVGPILVLIALCEYKHGLKNEIDICDIIIIIIKKESIH